MSHPIESQNNSIWFLRHYFRYEVHGLEKLESLHLNKKPFLIVSNHSTNLIDPLLFMHSYYEKYDIVPAPIGYSDFILDNPVFRNFADMYGLIGSKEFKKILKVFKKGKPILAYPGEEEESVLRNFHNEPYTLKWKKKLGLLKILSNNQLPLVFVASLGADELVTQSHAVKMPSIIKKIFGMADEIYEEALQLWTIAIHPPIKVIHIVTEPIYLEEYIVKRKDKIDTLYESLNQLERLCQNRLNDCLMIRESHSDDIDKFMKKFIEQGRILGL